MKNILIRAGKSPFDVVDARTCLRKNLIARNSGNILFSQSVYKAISAKNVVVDVNEFRMNALAPEEINEKYDAFVIPLANAFRRKYAPKLEAMASLIEKLTIPCVVVGVGAQSDVEMGIMEGSSMDAAVKRFVSAVLERSATIGVRGELTADYLNKLGFSAVDVIGCPSMYLNGANVHVEKRTEQIGPDARVAINLTPRMKSEAGDIFTRTWRDYENSAYVAQDLQDFELLYTGKPIEGLRKRDALPTTVNHPLYVDDRIRLFYDVPTWLGYMKGMDFSFGTRIHGNVFALLAGNPGFVVAHDSRTLELARYFSIPHILSSEITESTSAASLYDQADYSDFNRGHRARFDGFLSFLERNGLRTLYNQDGGEEEFDDRLSAVQFNGAVGPITSLAPQELRARLAFIHRRHRNQLDRLAG